MVFSFSQKQFISTMALQAVQVVKQAFSFYSSGVVVNYGESWTLFFPLKIFHFCSIFETLQIQGHFKFHFLARLQNEGEETHFWTLLPLELFVQSGHVVKQYTVPRISSSFHGSHPHNIFPSRSNNTHLIVAQYILQFGQLLFFMSHQDLADVRW